jgi:hypothetical protein
MRKVKMVHKLIDRFGKLRDSWEGCLWFVKDELFEMTEIQN